MWEHLLFWVGISAQLFGVGLTIVGVVWDWKDVKRAGDMFFRPYMELWRKVVHRLRRLFRRPSPQVIDVGGIASAVAVGGGNVYVSPGPLPEGLSTEDQITLVHQQLRDNIDRIYTQMFKLREDVRDDVREATAAHQRAVQVIDDREEERRRQAVSAVRLEAHGFLFLTLGTIIQAWGSYLGID